MKLSTLLFLSAAIAVNGEKLNPRHFGKRQAPGGTPGTPAPPPPSSTPVPTGTTTIIHDSSPVAQQPTVKPTTTPTAAPAPGPTTPAAPPPVAPGATTTPVAGAPSSVVPLPPAVPTGPPPLASGTGIPPLANITFGMPTRTALPAAQTFAPGSKPPVPGAPVIPTPDPSAFQLSSWPAQDKIPPTDSAEVKEWLKELDGWNIPNLSLTVNGSCALSPAQASDAANRGWWTCGGYTRPTDIVACPTKYDWGVSFDDGPSDYTQYLLNFLTEKQINATFFVVGSRVIQRPQILIEEYMTGHEISVHTWSHSALTNLTNEQIVAELGWTRKAIKTFIGVTPTTMRPPYGDIDDRVRTIALAMGMVPIMWTSSPTGVKFDTNDWQVAGGNVVGQASFDTFQGILRDAALINTGFVVLQHDLYEIAVDLAVGYTLNAALTHDPKFTLKSIGKCQNFPEGNLYLETNTNKTFPFHNSTAGSGGLDVSGDGTVDTTNGDATGSNPATGKSGAAALSAVPLVSSAVVVGLGLFSLLL